VIEAVKRDALDSMATLFESGWRRFVRPVVVNEAAVVVTVVVKTLESPTRKTAIFLVELRGFEPLTPTLQCENACAAACHRSTVYRIMPACNPSSYRCVSDVLAGD